MGSSHRWVNMGFLFSDDSDLNLVIDKESFTSAAPMFDHGFGYIWAGARATYGFQKGKVFYEVKVSKLFYIIKHVPYNIFHLPSM